MRCQLARRTLAVFRLAQLQLRHTCFADGHRRTSDIRGSGAFC